MNDPVLHSIRVAVVGASGYAGAELLGILSNHPSASVVALFGSSRKADEGAPTAADLFPRFEGTQVGALRVEPFGVDAARALELDAIFLATPHELSHEVAQELVDAGIVVLDLSAAFRLSDREVFERNYGFPHRFAALLGEAAYGLAEFNAAAVAKARLVAVPGCYPTASILAIRPLVEAGLVDTARPAIVDAVSGVSGAGRKAEVKSLFCEVSMQAYGVFKHRHRPEIAEHAGIATVFTPHLGCYDRGILATVHLEVKPGVSESAIRAAFESAYADRPFVRVLKPGRWPSVAAVERTNFCDIGFALEGSHLIVESAIDNLVKGAAGQAVQCMNIRFGLDETAGFTASGRTAATVGGAA
ncbi:MAG: N-acetyl-gamma-glutamyl-phosphate reductase [Planctomycetota bacterium]|jgi:N-acetyl-gamma-glutamyl-phosphate reductase